MVNVIKSNFIEQSNDFLHHLPQADFIAIDEEMTGIRLPGQGRPRKDESPSLRYVQALKRVPEHYSIIQLGVSLHTGRTVRMYNFYLFPSGDFSSSSSSSGTTREIVLNPEAVHFLNQHHMSFDLWTKSGVTYVTRDEATQMTRQYLTEEIKEQQQALQKQQQLAEGARASSGVNVQDTLKRTIELRRSEDVDFMARTMAELREWLDSDNNGNIMEDVDGCSQSHYVLPSCNSFLRRALYETISKEYPNLILESFTPEGGGWQKIRVLRLTDVELQQRRLRLQRERWNAFIQNRIGVWRIVSALRQVCHGYDLDRTHPIWASSFASIDWSRYCHSDDIKDQLEPHLLTTPTAEMLDPRPTPRLRRRVPLVVHNGWMDLCFLMTHFTSPTLPSSLQDCKQLIRSYFPVIFDTKLISTENVGYPDKNLKDLFDLVGDKDLKIMPPYQPVAFTATSIARDELLAAVAPIHVGDSPSAEHQADYDAYMTGAIFVGLSRHIKPAEIICDKDKEEDGEVIGEEEDNYRITSLATPRRQQDSTQWFETTLGSNRLYNLGIYTLDLESCGFESDPLSKGYLLESTYRVSDIDSIVTTRDIVSSLANLADGHGRRVSYDLIWVDDTTFIVATRYRQEVDAASVVLSSEMIPDDVENDAILTVHGEIVYSALFGKFGGKSTVISLDQVFKQREANRLRNSSPGWFTRFLQFTKLKISSDELDTVSQSERNPKEKRQRLS